MRKKEQTRHRISPAHQETVMAQMISKGIIKKTTYRTGNGKDLEKQEVDTKYSVPFIYFFKASTVVIG